MVKKWLREWLGIEKLQDGLFRLPDEYGLISEWDLFPYSRRRLNIASELGTLRSELDTLRADAINMLAEIGGDIRELEARIDNLAATIGYKWHNEPATAGYVKREKKKEKER
jgi:hypothetical protein